MISLAHELFMSELDPVTLSSELEDTVFSLTHGVIHELTLDHNLKHIHSFTLLRVSQEIKSASNVTKDDPKKNVNKKILRW